MLRSEGLHYSLQQTPTQHDMLPQHLICKNEPNREYVITLARNDKTPWWWSEKIETCRGGFKCFKLKLYRCICWLIVEVILRSARCNDEIYECRCLNNWCSVHKVFMCRAINSASHAVGEFKVIGSVILKKQILIHSLVFSLEGRAGRNQSPVMWPVWLWYTASWARSLGGSLPLLSPAFRRSHFSRQVPPSATMREILAAKGGTVGEKDVR